MTLRAWSADARTPLEDLPPLQDDSFTPETYRRLVEHITAALQAVTEGWLAALQRAVSRAATPFELGHELVSLRARLARRVQLSTHPALPPGLRAVLEKDVRDAVAQYQRELEEAVRRQTSKARLDHASSERFLRVVRENSFASVLGFRFDLGDPRPGPAPLPERDPHAPLVTGRRTPVRRVVPVVGQDPANPDSLQP